ncbi:MAG: TonB family protein [Gammaproteobacteria bacterium]|nr:TonB family protein [Gammaproteobacteria bacterium]
MSLTTEQGVNTVAIAVSVLLHSILFVQLTDPDINSQAQAPNFSTKISLNLMPPQDLLPQLVKADIPTPKPELKQKPVVKPDVVSKAVEVAAAVVPEQAVASKVAEEVQHGHLDDAAPIRKHYLNNLLTHIEGHKYYPQSARNRGINGSIEVSFELLSNGEISDLKAVGGPMVLRNAAKQAIESALPFPVPPEEVNCPLQVSYAMQFQLNN